MKIQQILTALVLSYILLASISCKKYQYGPYFSINSKAQRIEGSWKIDSAITRFGTDIKDTFTSYLFTFEADGETAIVFLPASGGGLDTLLGEWSLEEEKDLFAWKDLSGDTLGFYYNRNESFDILRLSRQEFWLADKDNTFLYFSPE